MKMRIRNIFAHLLALALVVAPFIGMDTYYADVGRVVDFDYERDKVIVMTCDGNLWEYEGIEDWNIGNMCGIMFYNNDTPLTIYDDVIVKLRYAMSWEDFIMPELLPEEPEFEEIFLPEEFIPEEIIDFDIEDLKMFEIY